MTIRGTSWVVLSGLLAWSWPVASAAPVQEMASTYVFECTPDLRFVVRIEGTVAWVFLPEKTVDLRRQSVPGDVYGDGRHRLLIDGQRASLEVDGRSWARCRNDARAAVWEAAKLRGVDFRASGNEPGWSLEIVDDGQTVYVGDYGEVRLEFPTPAPSLDSHGRTTVYRMTAGGHELTVVVTGRPCSDSMRGDDYEASVKLKLDGREYTGCGMALH